MCGIAGERHDVGQGSKAMPEKRFDLAPLTITQTRREVSNVDESSGEVPMPDSILVCSATKPGNASPALKSDGDSL